MSYENPDNCKHLSLTRSVVGSVGICPECGVVHLGLRHVSMRFELDAFNALAQMLVTAQRQIEHLNLVSPYSQENLEEVSRDVSSDKKIH